MSNIDRIDAFIKTLREAYKAGMPHNYNNGGGPPKSHPSQTQSKKTSLSGHSSTSHTKPHAPSSPTTTLQKRRHTMTDETFTALQFAGPANWHHLIAPTRTFPLTELSINSTAFAMSPGARKLSGNEPVVQLGALAAAANHITEN